MATIQEIKLAKLALELVQVEGAISASYSGAAYEIESGGSRRKLQRQNLSALLARKAEIEREIAVYSGMSNRVTHGVVIG